MTNKLKLFPDKEITLEEQGFQSYLAAEKIKLTRLMCLLSALLYCLFVLVDIFALPGALLSAIAIRGIVVAALFFTYAMTFNDSFIRFYDSIIAITYGIAVLGIEAMIYLATPSDQAYSTYFVGLILITVTLFSWTYLKLSISISLATFTILIYSCIEIFARDMVANGTFPTLLSNIFFLASSAIIGLVAQVMRDKYLRINYLLQLSLKDEVVEKTKEAESHAHLANHDQLTGLPNSRYAKDRLEKNLKRAKDLDMSLVIMYLDLNGFKQVNDIYGHKAGDEVLRIVGKRLKSCVRNGDCLARLGGDEFVIGLLLEKYELSIAQDIREKIEKVIVQPIGFEGNVLQIGTSVGMASYPASGDKVNVLIDIADKRMYNAKQKMKHKISVEEQTEFRFEDKTHPVVIFPG